MLFGVQDLVRQLFPLQQSGQQFGILDRGRADQHRLAALIAVLDILDYRLVFFLGGQVHLVHHVLADGRTVRRNDHRFQIVNLLELVGLGIRRSGHACQLAVHAEIILEGDRGQRLVLLLDRHTFLGFHRLMQPSDQRRPAIRRPVNSSTIITSPSCTT